MSIIDKMAAEFERVKAQYAGGILYFANNQEAQRATMQAAWDVVKAEMLGDDVIEAAGAKHHHELTEAFNISGIDDGSKCTTCQEIVKAALTATINKLEE